MAEYTAVLNQTVQPNANLIFTETPIDGKCRIVHREGSGIVTLRGITNQCKSRYKVFFGGNIAIPAGGTAGAVSVALAISGETVGSANMIATPAAPGEYFNVAGAVYVEVPKDCCLTISVKNSGLAAVDVQNANLIVECVA